MSNSSIRINLLKLKNTALTDVRGRTTIKKCVVIPVEDAGLFVGEKGVYLDLTAIGLKEASYGQSHFIRPNIPAEVYEKMTDSEKQGIPIVGNMKPLERKVEQLQSVGSVDLDNPDDLPF